MSCWVKYGRFGVKQNLGDFGRFEALRLTTSILNRSRRSGSSSSVGWARKSLLRGEGGVGGGGIGQPSVYHALVVIFLEFFAWGLLTNPMITVLAQTFPNHTFLMNGGSGKLSE